MSVFILMNNYFHDVATAMLAASGIAMWIIIKQYENSNCPDVRDYFFRLYRGIAGLAKVSLGWILIGGIPRTLTYKDFEWANALEKNQMPGLVVKHIITFILVMAGILIWVKLGKKIKIIRKR